MVFGRSAPEPADASVRQLVDDAHAAVRAASEQLGVVLSRVDQVRTRVREMAVRERNNPVLVQLCLDIENDLHGPYPENQEAAGG